MSWKTEAEIARRITFRGHRSISGLVVKLAVLSIMVAVAVMEVVLSIVIGFENEIHRKVMGFGSHIQVGVLLKDFDSRVEPLERYGKYAGLIRKLNGVQSIAPYVELPGMMKSKITQEGILMKGVDSTYSMQFFQACLVKGRLPDFNSPEESKEILISKKLANLLVLDTGKTCFVYFFKDKGPMDSESFGQNIEIRRVKVVGIYETGLEEFDKVRVLCDIRLLQTVLQLPAGKVTGFEIILNDPNDLERMTEKVAATLPPTLSEYPITEIYPEIFEWVALQHQNSWFILSLMVLIALINMTGVVLIMILERTQTIGLLKALGMNNRSVQRIFVFKAFFLILFGVIAGNILGLGLIFSQDALEWLKVDQANYFVTVVPVAWAWLPFALINLGVIIFCTFFMIIPSILITRISPSRALRFE